MMRLSLWLASTHVDKNVEQLGAFAVYLWKFWHKPSANWQHLLDNLRQAVRGALVPS
jgi:hypothetical protein